MSDVASDFWRQKYETDARKYWDCFYKTHAANFFKDRHWLAREWPDVFAKPSEETAPEDVDEGLGTRVDLARGPAPSYVPREDAPRTFLELGCGVGNTVFPLLELDDRATVYCCDFSKRAIDMVRERAAKLAPRDRDRVKAFVCDATCESLLTNVPAGCVDVATMVFALSAMSREKMKYCVRNLSTVMRDGQRGAICIRDYAVGDLAQERFEGKVGASQKLSENFYVRHDGTRAYYFTKDDLVALFAEEGMAMREVFLCQRMITNRADALDMNRRWIQGHFASATNMPTSFTPPERPKATTPWGN